MLSCSSYLLVLGKLEKMFGSSSTFARTGLSRVRFSSSLNPFNSIPGPKPLPIVGNLSEARDFLTSGKVGKEHIVAKLTKKYGAIYRLSFAGEQLVVISDADSVKKVFSNEGLLPVRSYTSEMNYKWIHDKNKMPIGLVSSYKEEWKRLRSAMQKQVTPRKISYFTDPLLAVSDELCRYIEEHRNSDGWLDDIWHPLQMWAMKGAAKVVFNRDIDCLLHQDQQSEEFIKAVREFTYYFGAINQTLPLYKIVPTKPYRRYVESFNKVRSLAKELLSDHYEKLRADIEAGTVDEDTAVGLLDQWLIEGKLTEDEALVQACDMMTAGVDTTSNTATFMLHELAKNPDVQEAVREEVVQIVGQQSSPTAEQLQKLSLVRKCVKETFRLYPLLPTIPRRVANDVDILGYHVPAGTTCLFDFFTLSTDPKYFDNPTKFNPERWSRDRDETHPFASLPFGFGPRMCYGRRIAELELHLLLTRVLQRFKLSTDQEIKYAFETVLHPVGTVGINFKSV